jgi:hypothetical protein
VVALDRRQRGACPGIARGLDVGLRLRDRHLEVVAPVDAPHRDVQRHAAEWVGEVECRPVLAEELLDGAVAEPLGDRLAKVEHSCLRDRRRHRNPRVRPPLVVEPGASGSPHGQLSAGRVAERDHA